MKVKKYLASICLSLCLLLAFPSDALGYTYVSRISGCDRYQTSVAVSRAGWDMSGSVVLASGDDFCDALSAVPLAKQLDAPILLTESDVLNGYVEGEIERLNASHIYIIGSIDAVSACIEDTLADKGLSCTRIYGDDRYQTSVEVAEYMASNFSICSQAVLVSGDDFSDAVSVSSAAAAKNMPVLLVSRDYMPQSARDFIKNYGIEGVYAIGGVNTISDEVLDGLPCVERICGGDRYQRNILVLSRFQDVLDFTTVYFAYGEDFPDALACSVLAAKTSSPVVLVNRTLSHSSRSFISSRLPAVKSAVAVGGSEMVSDAVLEELVQGSLDNTGAFSVKPYDEFALYLKDYISGIDLGDGILLGIDSISVSQGTDPGSINIYLDMEQDSHDRLVSYLNSMGSSGLSNVELLMKVIGNIASSQYDGVNINGSLWYVDSFDSRPEYYSLEDINFNPSTGKWDVMHNILDFSRHQDGGFEVEWKNN